MPKVTSTFFSNFGEDEDEKPIVDKPVDKIELEDNDNSDNTDTTTITEEGDGESTEVEDTDFFTTIINDQAEKGKLFYDPDKEYEGSGEEIFDEVIEDTLAKRYQEEYIDSIPEEYQSIFKHLKAGRPLDEWVEAVKQFDYDSIKLDDEDNQKMLIEEHLTLTGLDADDIKERLQELEDAGTLEKNAKTALKYLKKNEENKTAEYEKQLERAEKEQARIDAENLKEFKSEVLGLEELGGIKLSKSEREKLLKHITEPVNKKGESQLTINQKSRENQLLVAYMDMKGFKLSDLEKQAESKANKGLRAKLSTVTDTNAQRRGETQRVSTETKKVINGPWSATLSDED